MRTRYSSCNGSVYSQRKDPGFSSNGLMTLAMSMMVYVRTERGKHYGGEHGDGIRDEKGAVPL
jgi:hypothetical protein